MEKEKNAGYLRFIFLPAITPARPTVARMANGASGRQLPGLAFVGTAVGVAVAVAGGAAVTAGRDGIGVEDTGRGTV